MPKSITITHVGALGEPDARLEFEVRHGRPECVGVHVTAKPDGRGLRASDLAALVIDAVTREVFLRDASKISPDRKTAYRAEPPMWSEADERSLKREVARAADRPPGPPKGELLEVARVYAEHRDDSPIVQVGTILGYSRRTAARRIRSARDAGLLSDDGRFTPPPDTATEDEPRGMSRAMAERLVRRHHGEGKRS